MFARTTIPSFLLLVLDATVACVETPSKKGAVSTVMTGYAPSV